MAFASVRSRRRLVSAFAATAIVTLVGLGAGPALAASATWSTPVAITADQGDTVGTVTAPDGTITTVVESFTVGITAVSSTDGGATWETPVALGSGGEAAFRATIGITSTGLLAVAWVEEDTLFKRTIHVVISADGGSTWTAPTPLPTVSTDVDEPAIGSASALGFTVVWSEKYFDKRASSTIDGGATWSSSENITQDLNSYGSATLASVSLGVIVVVFQEFSFATGQTINSRRSNDGGVTWADAVTIALAPGGSINSYYTMVVSPSPGSLVVFWDDPTLFAATSTDSGNTWGPAIEVSVGPDDARDFAPVAVDASTVAVVWHPTSGSQSEAFYSEVELGATSASAPVSLNPASGLYYAGRPTLTAFGTSRVVTWFAEGQSASGDGYGSAVSCDGGATWRVSTTIAARDDVSRDDAVVALSGTVVTAFWSEFDSLIKYDVPRAAIIDDPCSVPVAQGEGGELAATGTNELALGVFFAALGILTVGLAAHRVRRAAVRA